MIDKEILNDEIVHPYNEKTKMWGQLRGYEWSQANVEIETSTYNRNSQPIKSHLNCPRCDSEFLHQYRVEVFARPEDSIEEYFAVDCGHSLSNPTVNKDTLGNPGNPSDRRQGIKIHFTCEQCGPGLELGISQHQGYTNLSWNVWTIPGK